jgi:transposase-like protein
MQDKLNEFSNEIVCPQCGSKTVSKVKYTWWGGVLGPKLLHHTKCEDCKYTFNSKTGKSNTPGIVIYSLVIFVVAFAAFYFIRSI